MGFKSHLVKKSTTDTICASIWTGAVNLSKSTKYMEGKRETTQSALTALYENVHAIFLLHLLQIFTPSIDLL